MIVLKVTAARSRSRYAHRLTGSCGRPESPRARGGSPARCARARWYSNGASGPRERQTLLDQPGAEVDRRLGDRAGVDVADRADAAVASLRLRQAAHEAADQDLERARRADRRTRAAGSRCGSSARRAADRCRTAGSSCPGRAASRRPGRSHSCGSRRAAPGCRAAAGRRAPSSGTAPARPRARRVPWRGTGIRGSGMAMPLAPPGVSVVAR